MAARTQIIGIALIAGLSGGWAVSLLSGGSSSQPAPVAGAGYAAEFERVRAELDEFRRTFEASVSAIRSQSSNSQPTREPVSVGRPLPQLEERLDELTNAVKHLLASGGASIERISAARRSNPSPNIAELRLLLEGLDSSSGSEQVARGWLMMSMEEVIRKVGPPMNIMIDDEHRNRQRWEYFLSAQQEVVFQFVDGLVVAVSM